jgi:RHS repeat-associated protein
VTQPGYNVANLLEKLDVWLKHAGEPAELLAPDTADEHFVTNIDYNARGQRTLIQYGNDAETRYHYDPATFRLVQLYTRRDVSYNEDCGDDPDYYPAPDMSPQDTPCGLQNLHYTYDPVGNIIAIRDDAQHTIYFNGQVVRPDAQYTYDALYRLIEATGREHIGQASQPHTTWNDKGRVNLAHPNDGQKMRNYFEFYEYDDVGNFLSFDHKAHNGNWIRTYEYDEASLIELDKQSNRLSCTIVHPNGQHPISELYTYDPHGNMISMPYLTLMQWDYRDQLQASARQVVNNGGTPETTYYVYDAAGQRVRKVTERKAAAGETARKKNERIYLGGFEIYREYNGDGEGPELERETLHVMDDQQRIALVETRTLDTADNDQAPQKLVRYQFGNHLGSGSLELDAVEVSAKRYRYTGMERDEETGLIYHGARYYATCLGRWGSCDPSGVQNGVNLFVYVSDNPINKVDLTGNYEIDWTQIAIGAGIAVAGLAVGLAVAAVVVGTGGLGGVALLTAAGVSTETIGTIGSVLTAGLVAAGTVSTAATIAEVQTGQSAITGETLSNEEWNRRVGALPIHATATVFGIGSYLGGGGGTSPTGLVPVGAGPGGSNFNFGSTSSAAEAASPSAVQILGVAANAITGTLFGDDIYAMSSSGSEPSRNREAENEPSRSGSGTETAVVDEVARLAKVAQAREPGFTVLWSQRVGGIDPNSHSAQANAALLRTLLRDPIRRARFDKITGTDTVAAMRAGVFGLKNPTGMVWHHPKYPNYVNLVFEAEHTAMAHVGSRSTIYESFKPSFGYVHE